MWGSGEVGKWGSGEVGKWGSGVWGVGRINKNNLLSPISYLLSPVSYLLSPVSCLRYNHCCNSGQPKP
ncbi:MAG: hypothetical protein EWV81_17035 [Microcystis aeruginosa Ma_SC_T_19800800_S464]|uniref:Uncharacterized protein n=1 Tax=Microcystis aeruginosa Ma_SC_T_19800800_S464 TaxID=2486257 RepID=A0A552DLJ9_MICAE|nr:MAG: hypothetical protein EWV81_17035 [Microcystis aeruginosa Ma_SC_T_19800800_S464]